MLKVGGVGTPLELTKPQGKKAQVILVIMYNPGSNQQEQTIELNDIVIFKQNIPANETVLFNQEKFLIEEDSDKLKVLGSVNKTISYAEY